MEIRRLLPPLRPPDPVHPCRSSKSATDGIFWQIPPTPFRDCFETSEGCWICALCACLSQSYHTALEVIYELRWLRNRDSIKSTSLQTSCHLASLSLQSVGNSPIWGFLPRRSLSRIIWSHGSQNDLFFWGRLERFHCCVRVDIHQRSLRF